MIPNALAEENGSRMPPHMPAVFLTHASLPSHIAADSDLINSAFTGSHRNRWVRYDFDRFLLSQRSTARLVELISLWLMLIFPHLLKIVMSGKSNIVGQDPTRPPTRLLQSKGK